MRTRLHARRLLTPQRLLRLLLVLPTFAAVGCHRATSSVAPVGSGSPPPLAPIQLTPVLARFQELAKAAPPIPSADELAPANALLESAFVDLGDHRLQTKSRSALLAEPLVGPALEAALEHEIDAIRQGAAFELGSLARPAALVPLLKRLKYEPDKTVRVWVADALVRRGCGSGLAELLSALREPTTADLAGQRAIDILRVAGHDLPDPPTWDAIAQGLRRIQQRWHATGTVRDDLPVIDDATRGRLAQLMCALEGFQLRPVDDARFMLARSGAAALPLLREACAASEPYLRTHTLEVLRDLGHAGQDLASEVLPLLDDPLTRTDAARALAAMGAHAAVPHLLAWLRGPDPELRTAAAQALGPIGDRSTLPELRARMDDANETMDVRVMAAFSVALFELDRPGYRFLQDLRDRGAYHEPTLAELIDRIDRAK